MDVTHPHYDQEPLVREIVKRCGKFVSTYRAIRDLPSYYEKGWVGLVWEDGEPLGFWVIRHGTRNEWTTIHEIGVVPEAQRRGLGSKMIDAILAESPHGRLRLVCDERNAGGIAFYKDQGFYARGVRENRAGERIIDMELVT